MVTITRDPDYPAEHAQLVAAFNQVAGNYDVNTVFNASVQMVVAAIQAFGSANGLSLDQALEIADHAQDAIRYGVRVNWRRVSQASDIEVKPQ